MEATEKQSLRAAAGVAAEPTSLASDIDAVNQGRGVDSSLSFVKVPGMEDVAESRIVKLVFPATVSVTLQFIRLLPIDRSHSGRKKVHRKADEGRLDDCPVEMKEADVADKFFVQAGGR